MRAHRLGLLTIILAVLAVVLLPSPGQPDGRPSFTVGVLRRDGVILPFATYDGSKWTNRWPAEHSTDLPIGLDDVPKGWWADGRASTTWTAWLTSGASRPVTVSAPVAISVHCTRRVGLRSDFVAAEPPPPPDFQPYPKSGLAVTGSSPITIERIELLPVGSPEATAVADKVKDSVTAAETRKAKAWANRTPAMDSWTHPVDEKGRAKTPLSLEVLARTPGLTVGSTASYFEGVKKYPGFIQVPENSKLSPSVNGLPQLCEYLTFAGGWVLTGTKESIVSGADLSNCNREGLVYTLPLGAVRTGGRLFWIVQASSWDFERYDVIEIKQTDVRTVLSVGGGTCR